MTMSVILSEATALPTPVRVEPESHAREDGGSVPPTPSRRLVALRDLVVPVLSIAVVGAFAFTAMARWDAWIGKAAVQVTDNAYVRAEVTRLASRISGTVRIVAVEDFQHVRTGDLLVEVDPADYQVQISKDEASLTGSQSALQNLENQMLLQRAMIAQAEAQHISAAAREVQAEQERARQETLVKSNFGTRQKLEAAIADYAKAKGDLKASEAATAAQHRQLDVLAGTRNQRAADVKAAEAALAASRLRLSYTRITAPFDGVVGERQVQPGDYVNTGTNLIAVVPLPNVHVVSNYKETQLTHLSPGQRVDITVDTFPGQILQGHVGRLSPASGSQFALLPPDNATGNFTKVVQRIPVRIEFEPGQNLLARLRPGMSVTTRVHVDGFDDEDKHPSRQDSR